MPSKIVLRSLYRSLLRASSPFSPPSPSYSVYSSLIHRRGGKYDLDWDTFVKKLEKHRAKDRLKQQLVDSSKSFASLGSSDVASSRNGDGDETDKTRSIGENDSQSTNSTEDGKVKKLGHLPKNWARNLTRSYRELQEEFYDNDDEFNDDDFELFADDDSDSDDDGEILYEKRNPLDDQKEFLFCRLLEEWFAGALGGTGSGNGDQKSKKTIETIPSMRFPSQISDASENGGLSIRQLIQREFRAPTVEEICKLESQNQSLEAEQENSKEMDARAAKQSTSVSLRSKKKTSSCLPSSYIDTNVRVQTAFYVLSQLNRKLAWAERAGFPIPPKAHQEEARRRRNQIRLAQAAKGVIRFPQKSHIDQNSTFEQLPTTSDSTSKDGECSNDGEALSENDHSPKLSSYPLQCGSYLIAHPLMKGYFAKSVIVLLDHAEAEDGQTKPKNAEDGGAGGTYGLIINRLAMEKSIGDSNRRRLELIMHQKLEQKKLEEKEQEKLEEATGDQSNIRGISESDTSNSSKGLRPQKPDEKVTISSSIFRPISLSRVFRPDVLPETVRLAFGDSPVREGGPVNVSVQMLHRKCVGLKQDESITESVYDSRETTAVEGSAESTRLKNECKIGGTRIPPISNGDGEDTACSKSNNKTEDKEILDDAIFFGGDLVIASIDVSDGIKDREDFSFIIGASCWAPGQLENEIEQGFWLPFRGPPSMAMSGMCEHNDISENSSKDCKAKVEGECHKSVNPATATTTAKQVLFPPGPSHSATSLANTATVAATEAEKKLRQSADRPLGDLWLSIMCALGEGEAELGYMMLEPKNINDEFGDACDNFK